MRGKVPSYPARHSHVECDAKHVVECARRKQAETGDCMHKHVGGLSVSENDIRKTLCNFRRPKPPKLCLRDISPEAFDLTNGPESTPLLWPSVWFGVLEFKIGVWRSKYVPDVPNDGAAARLNRTTRINCGLLGGPLPRQWLNPVVPITSVLDGFV